jgi:hypothetical protein
MTKSGNFLQFFQSFSDFWGSGKSPENRAMFGGRNPRPIRMRIPAEKLAWNVKFRSDYLHSVNQKFKFDLLPPIRHILAVN